MSAQAKTKNTAPQPINPAPATRPRRFWDMEERTAAILCVLIAAGGMIAIGAVS